MFFEELAIYPAAHVLSAHILALFGLYDYVAFTHDNKIEVLIQRGIDTLHTNARVNMILVTGHATTFSKSALLLADRIILPYQLDRSPCWVSWL